MVDIKSMTLEELTAWFKEQGEPAFRAKQVFRWLYRCLLYTSPVGSGTASLKYQFTRGE